MFEDLMRLCETDESFYYSDMRGEDGYLYRIFLYRLGSYSSFLLPGALESRGVMYRQEDHGFWTLVCRPMTKFFNWNENPFTTNLDFSHTEAIMVKEDGSLISTYIDGNGFLQLKSKGSIKSEQAIAARNWLKQHPEYEANLYQDTANGLTVNCEWTSPLNRIVEVYEVDRLIVIGARMRQSGLYAAHSVLVERYGQENVVKLLNVAPEEVEGMDVGEGVVIFFGNHAPAGSNFVKIKTGRYRTLHKLKDGVNNPGALYDAVLEERTDDLKSAFSDNAFIQKSIALMESLVVPQFNHYCKVVLAIHNQHKHCDRKTYAVGIKAMLLSELPEQQAAVAHGVCMMLYLGREYDLKETFSKATKVIITNQYAAQLTEEAPQWATLS